MDDTYKLGADDRTEARMSDLSQADEDALNRVASKLFRDALTKLALENERLQAENALLREACRDQENLRHLWTNRET